MRRAAPDDIPELVEMGRKYHTLMQPEWELSEAGLAQTLAVLMDSGYVMRTEAGFIVGVIQPNPIAVNWLVASELLWWAEDGNGHKLRRGFRDWAKERAASEIRWSCPPENERVRRHYAKFAEESEIIYSEYLTCA
ncbi:MAG: hypothetical protein ACPG4X_19335 [Pikeienuella sp.]